MKDEVKFLKFTSRLPFRWKNSKKRISSEWFLKRKIKKPHQNKDLNHYENNQINAYKNQFKIREFQIQGFPI
jgi:hypothetical protein